MSRRTQFANDHAHRPKHPKFRAPVVAAQPGTAAHAQELGRLLDYLATFWFSVNRRASKYTPHQGMREQARRRGEIGYRAHHRA